MSESSTKQFEDLQAFEPGRVESILADAARDRRDDPDFRARLEADPRGELEARGVPLGAEEGVEVALHVNTPDVFHLVMVADPNTAVSDQYLSAIAGGSTASSAGSVGTVSTVGSFLSTVGSGASVSSVGSGGSATGD